ncbi:MAG: hypothetical protein ACRDNJ_09990 [Solirubrobacteraceae bacterium]
MTLLAEIALVVVAAAAAVAGVALLPRSERRARSRAVATGAARPAQLVALERLVGTAQSSPVHLHARLRPVLAEIVSRRLVARGLALERLGERAGRELLGEQLWELVRPGRPFPVDRYGPGLPARELDALLDVIERL